MRTPNYKKIYLGKVGVLPNHGSFNINHQTPIPQPYSPATKNISKKRVIERWHPTKHDKHSKLVVVEALCHNSCNKIYFYVLNAVHQCREASMCLVGRSVTIQIGISRHDLAATNKRLVGANGAQIELDSTVFLNIIMGNTTSSQRGCLHPDNKVE